MYLVQYNIMFVYALWTDEENGNRCRSLNSWVEWKMKIIISIIIREIYKNIYIRLRVWYTSYVYYVIYLLWRSGKTILVIFCLHSKKGRTIKATSLVCACFLSLVYRSSTLYGSQKFTRSTHSAVVELCARCSLYHV